MKILNLKYEECIFYIHTSIYLYLIRHAKCLYKMLINFDFQNLDFKLLSLRLGLLKHQNISVLNFLRNFGITIQSRNHPLLREEYISAFKHCMWEKSY